MFFTFEIEFRHVRLINRYPSTFFEAIVKILDLAGIFRISPLLKFINEKIFEDKLL
jgi:hypothetical protein